MGRKALPRARKELTKKTKTWVRDLIPLLQDQDLTTFTLDELAELSGKSKSTIYTYFSTKEEIYEKAVSLYLEDLAFLISPEAVQGEDMEHVLRQMLLGISKGIEGISIRFMDQMKHEFPQIWKEIEAFIDRLLANFEIIYRRGMEAGTFRSFDLPLLLAMDRHFVLNMMTDSKEISATLSLNQLVKEYLELRLSALRLD